MKVPDCCVRNNIDANQRIPCGRFVNLDKGHELPRWRHLGDIFPRRLAVDASVSCWLLGHVDYFGFAAISLKKMYPDTLFA